MERLIAVIFSIFALTSIMQAQLGISAELRPRTEYSHGLKSLSMAHQDPSLATSQRTRINLHYSADKVNLFVSLQDVRTWGNQSQLVTNEMKSASIHQAWGEVIFTSVLSLKAGRMELVYDDQRMLGSVGWAQQARSHDLALLKYEKEFKAHLGLAYNESGELRNNIYRTPNSYKAMQYLWLNKSFDRLSASVLVLNNGVPYTITMNEDEAIISQGIRYSLTTGAFVNVKLTDNLGLDGSFYSQSGTDVSGKSLTAHQFAINLNAKASDQIAVIAGFEQLSGTDVASEGKNKSFSPLYGTNHKFNGFMDYFYVGNHGNSVGLNDAYLKGSFKLGSVVLGAHYHYFSAAAKLAANASAYLGSEVDITCSYQFGKEVNLSCGYSQMLASESMELIKTGDGSQINNWAWLMLSINTGVFYTKK